MTRPAGCITNRSFYSELTDKEFGEICNLNEIIAHMDQIRRVTFDDMNDDYVGRTIRELTDAVYVTVNKRKIELDNFNKDRFVEHMEAQIEGRPYSPEDA